jgi:hypothetical protein
MDNFDQAWRVFGLISKGLTFDNTKYIGEIRQSLSELVQIMRNGKYNYRWGVKWKRSFDEKCQRVADIHGKNFARELISLLIGYGERFWMFPGLEIDDYPIESEKEDLGSDWLRTIENEVETETRYREKQRRLEMLKLLDTLAFGWFDQLDRFDASNYVWRFERSLIYHKKRCNKKFIRWKSRTRLKELLSTCDLKRMWRWFGFIFTKYRDKGMFIRMGEHHLSDLISPKGAKRVYSGLKARFPYKERTIGTSYLKSREPHRQFSRSRIGQYVPRVPQFQKSSELKIQWAIIRRLSKWRNILQVVSARPKELDLRARIFG